MLPDPTGEQTRPLVVRKAKVRPSAAQVLPMSLGMMAGPGPRVMDPSLHLVPGQVGPGYSCNNATSPLCQAVAHSMLPAGASATDASVLPQLLLTHFCAFP